MISVYSCLVVSFLAAQCVSKSPIQRGFEGQRIERRVDSHADHNCDHNTNYESSRGQESRLEPSRQYLPQPGPVPSSGPPINIETPAASFEQPTILSVENTFLSPSLQSNYKSLFGQNKKNDVLAPAAAQNAPTNVLLPSAPRITSDKKHSHDDEDNLERLCNDAFHSFLCKPIKGPRKTPTGRLRPNAVIPPDVLSGFASFQNVARVKPDTPKPTTPKPYSHYPTTRFTPPPTTTRTYEPFVPEIPSPSNNNIQILKPKFPNETPLKTSAQTTGYAYERPAVSFPAPIAINSNQNQQFISQRPTFPTPRPTTLQPPTINGYSYDKPNIPFPSNTVQNYAQPPKHDCDRAHPPSPFPIPNPSNENPTFLKPFIPSTSKPTTKTFYTRPVYTPPKIYSPKTPEPAKPQPEHDCQKNGYTFTPSTEKPNLPLPSNIVPQVLVSSSSKPSFQNNYKKQNSQPSSSNIIRTSLASYTPVHDCKNNQFSSTTENPRFPAASNNVANIIAQPQQINTVTISPKKPSGYFYEKPAVPFPPPQKVTTQRPTPPPFTYQTTQKPTGYNYEQPRIPFPSNNIAQIISAQPTSPTTTPKAPCEHDQSRFHLSNKPTNQNSVSLKPAAASEAYVYDKPSQPFNGYNYEKPSNPFLLPSPAKNPPQVIASPANTGYTYEKPSRPFPPQTNQPTENNPVTIIPVNKQPGYSYEAPKIPFPSNINSKLTSLDNKTNFVAKPQTQVEVKVKPGYFYDRPSNPFIAEQGYTYSKPLAPFR